MSFVLSFFYINTAVVYGIFMCEEVFLLWIHNKICIIPPAPHFRGKKYGKCECSVQE
jgi:hypothetical protein